MPKILKTKKQPKNQNKCFLYLTSLFKGFIILFLGFLLISLLIYKVKDTEFYYFSLFAIIAISSFVSAYTSCKKVGDRGIICGFISSSIFLLLVILVVLIIAGFDVSPRIIITVPVCLVPGIAGGILSANT